MATRRSKIIMGQSATFNKTDDRSGLLTAVAGATRRIWLWVRPVCGGEWAARGAFMSLQTFLDRDLKERPDRPVDHPS